MKLGANFGNLWLLAIWSVGCSYGQGGDGQAQRRTQQSPQGVGIVAPPTRDLGALAAKRQSTFAKWQANDPNLEREVLNINAKDVEGRLMKAQGLAEAASDAKREYYV